MASAAAYVGRVGGLALALGIGTAVATGQGVALADSTAGTSGPSSNSRSGSQSEPADARHAESTTPDPVVGQGSTPSPAKHRFVPTGGGIAHADDGAHQGSDLTVAHSAATSGIAASTHTKPTSPGEAQPSSISITGANRRTTGLAAHTSAGVDIASGPMGTRLQPPTTASSSSTSTSRRAAQPALTSFAPAASTVPATPPTNILTGVLAAFGLSALAGNNPLTPVEPPAIWGLLAWTRRQDAQTSVINGAATALIASANAATSTPTGTAAAPLQAIASQSGSASIAQVLAYTFFNKAPTASPTADCPDCLTGNLNAQGPDGALLTYTATQPSQGTVVVNSDGSYIYTPNTDLENNGGTDSFAVTIDDGSAYRLRGLPGVVQGLVHSLAQIIGLSGPDTKTVNVTVNVTVTVSATPAPSTFTVTPVVSGLTAPTDFRFLPDGRILFAEKGGAIKVANTNGALQSTPVITLPVDSTAGRGLLAIAVDPNYQTNGYIYAVYTTADDSAGNTYERLSRFTTVTDPATGVITADPASELVLVQGNQPGTMDHFGGGLAFGPDGKLYFSTGDNVCCSVLDGSNSQNLSNIYGKVLRINPDGTVPADNPFVNTPGADPRVYAYGFRNAFRLTFTPDGQLLVADVGQKVWEEVDLVTPGANYGWPLAEGPCNGIGTTSCATPSSYTNPIYAYQHAPSGGDSITAVMVYTGPGSAGGSQHTVLIADFNQGWIRQLTFNSDYSSLISATQFTTAAPGQTDKLAQGPDGNIYQLVFSSGTLSRITPTTG